MNLISISRLDSSCYRWKVDNGILKVMHDNRIVLKEKKYGGYYLLVESSARDRASDASGSSVQVRVSGIDGLDTRWEI